MPSSYYENLISAPGLVTGVMSRHIDKTSFLSTLGLEMCAFLEMEQTHGNSISIVNDDSPAIIPGADAIITTSRNTVIAVRTADCLPLLVYHPDSPVIAAIHAGRKSTELKITKETLTIIQDQYGISGGFHIWLGPCICKDCHQIDPKNDLHFDLVSENLAQINSVSANNTLVYHRNDRGGHSCTACESNHYFSYRQGDKTDRLYSVICLR